MTKHLQGMGQTLEVLGKAPIFSALDLPGLQYSCPEPQCSKEAWSTSGWKGKCIISLSLCNKWLQNLVTQNSLGSKIQRWLSCMVLAQKFSSGCCQDGIRSCIIWRLDWGWGVFFQWGTLTRPHSSAHGPLHRLLECPQNVTPSPEWMSQETKL